MDRLIFFCLQYLNVESKYFKLLKAVKAITRSTDVNKIIVKFVTCYYFVTTCYFKLTHLLCLVF